MTEAPGEGQVEPIVLGLGSNQGDRVRNLERALGDLGRDVVFEDISWVYETEPVGFRDQPNFLNLVCMGYTRLNPRELLQRAKEIERRLGRKPGPRFGPRPIDVDILAYGDRIVALPGLEIPHPRLRERRFVLEPLAEIAPDWRDPRDGKSAKELLDELEASEGVRPFGPPPKPAEAPPVA